MKKSSMNRPRGMYYDPIFGLVPYPDYPEYKVSEKECVKEVDEEPKHFIAFDWCGWNDKYGRFTHEPSGDTLTCKGWMGQSDWDKAQLEWFKKYPLDLIVHRCLTGAYRETGDTMGSVETIIGRLENRI